MGTLSYALVEPLAPDYLWPVFLLVVILAIMGGLRALGVRIDGWRRARHLFRGLREKKHDPKSQGHQ